MQTIDDDNSDVIESSIINVPVKRKRKWKRRAVVTSTQRPNSLPLVNSFKDQHSQHSTLSLQPYRLPFEPSSPSLNSMHFHKTTQESHSESDVSLLSPLRKRQSYLSPIIEKQKQEKSPRSLASTINILSSTSSNSSSPSLCCMCLEKTFKKSHPSDKSHFLPLPKRQPYLNPLIENQKPDKRSRSVFSVMSTLPSTSPRIQPNFLPEDNWDPLCSSDSERLSRICTEPSGIDRELEQLGNEQCANINNTIELQTFYQNSLTQEISNQIHQLKKYVRDKIEQIEQRLNILKRKGVSAERDNELVMPKLPINKLEMLSSLNYALEERQFFDRFAKEISPVVKNHAYNLKNSIYAIMSQMFTLNLLRKFSWSASAYQDSERPYFSSLKSVIRVINHIIMEYMPISKGDIRKELKKFMKTVPRIYHEIHQKVGERGQ